MMRIPRRTALALPLLATAARAQEGFPSRPVKLVVPFPPGGSADLSARILAEKLAAAWPQPVVIENRPGAGTTIASAAAARAAPDGHTLYLAYNLSYAATATLYRNLPYDPAKDLVAVSAVADAPFVLAVGPRVEAQDVASFLHLARTEPRPLLFGSTGVGAGPHLATELLLRRLGLPAEHVPYRGTAEVIVGLITGQVQFSLLDVAALGALRAGQVRPLAVTTARPWALMPEVAPLAQRGVAGFDISSGSCILAPAGLPPALLARLNADIVAALAAPDVVRRYAEQGFAAAGSTPAELARRIAADTAALREVILALGLRAE